MARQRNTSTAVMQRRVEPHDSLDYFPTPPWATRALCKDLSQFFDLADQVVWEPACGEGHMSGPLGEYFGDVHTSDVHDYSDVFPEQGRTHDFALPWDGWSPDCDWVITNPPFRLAEEFIERALSHSSVGCAVLVRTSFLEGIARFNNLFSCNPPFRVLQFTERVAMFKGKLDPNGTTATSYCWVVWLQPEYLERYVGADGMKTVFDWIAPCRKALERHGDYPAAAPSGSDGPLFGGDA